MFSAVKEKIKSLQNVGYAVEQHPKLIYILLSPLTSVDIGAYELDLRWYCKLLSQQNLHWYLGFVPITYNLCLSFIICAYYNLAYHLYFVPITCYGKKKQNPKLYCTKGIWLLHTLCSYSCVPKSIIKVSKNYSFPELPHPYVQFSQCWGWLWGRELNKG